MTDTFIPEQQAPLGASQVRCDKASKLLILLTLAHPEVVVVVAIMAGKHPDQDIDRILAYGYDY